MINDRKTGIFAASKHFENSGNYIRRDPSEEKTNSIVCIEIFHSRYTRTGLVASAGFSNPITDPTVDDLKIWMAEADKPPKDLDMMQARYLLEQVADEFCDLYSQEQMAKAVHMSEGIYYAVVPRKKENLPR